MLLGEARGSRRIEIRDKDALQLAHRDATARNWAAACAPQPTRVRVAADNAWRGAWPPAPVVGTGSQGRDFRGIHDCQQATVRRRRTAEIAPWIVGRPRAGFPGKLALVLAAKYARRLAALTWNPPPGTCIPRIPGGSIFPSACRRKAVSTASMQSRMSSKAAMSERVRRSVSTLLPCRRRQYRDHASTALPARVEQHRRVARGRGERIGRDLARACGPQIDTPQGRIGGTRRDQNAIFGERQRGEARRPCRRRRRGRARCG